MRNIVVGSAFRDAVGRQITTWLDQVQALRDAVGDEANVRCVAVEGDSVDGTINQLTHGALSRELDLELVVCNTGAPRYPSCEDPDRMAALSKVGNAILDSVRLTDDILVYVESDLVWDAPTIALMAWRVKKGEVHAPMVFAGGHFYDVWAYRKNGARFAPFHPYHSELNPAHLTEVDSVGSCLVMDADIARSIRIRNGDALVGWCDEARKAGFHIFVDPLSRIYHPA